MADRDKGAPPRDPGGEPTKGQAQPKEYQLFLDSLRWPQAAPQSAPRPSAEAVLCTLVRRFSGAEEQELIDQLPKGFRVLLRLCPRHEGQALQPVEQHAFIGDVADHLAVDPQQAELVVRAVFGGIRERLSEDEVEEVAAQLPEQLADLWRRPA